ncbi:hypothetical protein AKN87_07070 [Thiopseudomonas alkaliphila]|nr:hypothetical protein AKN87_07070 [Thiopseudomonas alkaliphila]
MSRKDIITLTIECSMGSFLSFIDLLESQQNTLFIRKRISTTSHGDLARSHCVVCLFGVTDTLAVMCSIAKQLKTLSTVHGSPIFLKAFSVNNQE